MMKKDNFYTDTPDIAFHLEHRMDMNALFQWLPQEDREAVAANNPEEFRKAWQEFLETFGEFCATTIAPNAAEVDRSHPHLDAQGEVQLPKALQDNLKAIVEMGYPGIGISPKFGGMGSNFLMAVTSSEFVSRSCPSTNLNSCWWGSIAHIIAQFGSEELQEKFIPRMATGEWSGSMALTEPEAGSDLSAVRTYGEAQADGTWKIYGSKRFISNGSGQVCLVLAKKSKGAEGLNSMNLFLCPRIIDSKQNFKVSKIEEKIGLHGSATCELNFDGATGYLIGKEGDGFRQMLKLMNEARIGVAYQALGNMQASFHLARDYSEQRKTWGKPINQHELIAEKLLDMEVELAAFRSLCNQAAYNHTMEYYGEHYLESHADLSDEEKRQTKERVSAHRRRTRRWTPLVKWWAGERSQHFARECLMIHGGYGFSTEYRAEWLMRESLILAIYEGTSQIQALMCTKDTLKEAVGNPREFVEVAMGLRLKGLAETDELRRKLYRVKQIAHGAVASVIFRLVRVNIKSSIAGFKTRELKNALKLLGPQLLRFDNLAPALLHAERICEIKCWTALCEVAVWDAETDSSRRWIADRLFYKALPRIQQLKAEIETDDPVIMRRLGIEMVDRHVPSSQMEASPQ